MSNKEAKKPVGRPDAFKDEEIMDKRIKIWISHFYEKLPYWELTEKYGVSISTVRKAIGWVQKNFVKIPSESILRGAIFSIEERIKNLTKELDKERGKDQPSIRSMVELNREIREDSRDLLKLQSLYKETYSIEVEAGGSIREILREITKDKK